MAFGRELVLALTGEPADLADVLLGAGTHVHRVERAPEAVVDHRVDEIAVAHPVAAARAGKEIRRLRHRLHAAGDDDFGVTVLNHLVGEVDRVDAREAHLVDRHRGDGHRDAGLDRGLTRGDLTLTPLQDLAHEDVVDLFGVDAGAFERGLDRDAAELHRTHAGERARQLADGSPRRTNDHRAGHRGPPHMCTASVSVCTGGSFPLPAGSFPAFPTVRATEGLRCRRSTPSVPRSSKARAARSSPDCRCPKKCAARS